MATIDVVLHWTLGGVVQDPLTLAQGFTYTAALAATGPDPALPLVLGALLLTAGLGIVLTARSYRASQA